MAASATHLSWSSCRGWMWYWINKDGLYIYIIPIIYNTHNRYIYIYILYYITHNMYIYIYVIMEIWWVLNQQYGSWSFILQWGSTQKRVYHPPAHRTDQWIGWKKNHWNPPIIFHGKIYGFRSRYSLTIWLFNIAMERSTHFQVR